MSVKQTECSSLEWNIFQGLLKLIQSDIYNTERITMKRDKLIRFRLLIGLGGYWGLRASELLNLQWSMIHPKQPGEKITVKNGKTRKKREITMKQEVHDLIKESYELLNPNFSYCFHNKHGKPFSVHYLNQELKKIFSLYRIFSNNPSSHTLRKTFGKRVWEMHNQSEASLIKLSEIFNHANTSITRKYLGIARQEIGDIYMEL